MGKGNRNKQNRYQDQVQSPDKYVARQKVKKSSGITTSGKIAAIICIILAVCIIGIFVMQALNNAGVILRNTDALKTENYEVDAAMMSYLLNNYIMSWYNQNYYYIYLGQYDVDLTKDLKKQYQDAKNNVTWYDYFVDLAVEQATQYLEMAEGAKAAGLSLDSDDYAEIDEAIKEIEETFKTSGGSYAIYFGTGVKEKDVRKVYELIHLANKFSEHKTSLIKDELNKFDDKVSKDNPIYTYLNGNKGSFYTADCLTYTFSLNSKNFDTDKDFEDAVDLAKEYSSKLEEAADAEEFKNIVKEYDGKLKELLPEATTTAGTTTAETEEDSTEDSTTTEEESTTVEEETTEKELTSEENVKYQTSTDLGKWLFAETDGEFTVKINSVFNVQDKDNPKTESETDKTGKENTYQTYSLKSYMVLSKPDVDHTITHDIGYVITDDETIANKLLEEFKKGEMGMKKLYELANAEKEQLPEDTEKVIITDAMENASASFFENGYGEDFAPIDELIEGENVKPGATPEVKKITYKYTDDNKKEQTKDYYVICYYEAEGFEAWYAQAFTGRANEMFDEWYEGTDGKGGQLALTPVTKNEKALDDLYTMMYSTN